MRVGVGRGEAVIKGGEAERKEEGTYQDKNQMKRPNSINKSYNDVNQGTGHVNG